MAKANGEMAAGSAGGIVFRDGEGRLEILLITTRGDKPSWIFPKGHVEAGEDEVQAALREVREESGVTGVAVTHLDPQLRARGGGDEVVQYVVVRALADGEPEPGRDKRWVSPNEALVLLTHEDSRRLLLAALAAIDPARGADRLADLVLAEHHHLGRALLARERLAEGRAVVAVAVGVGTWLLAPEQPLALAGALVLGLVLFRQLLEDLGRIEDAARGLARLRGALIRAEDPRRPLLPFDPHATGDLARVSAALGRGGPLLTLILVDAALAGALAGSFAPLEGGAVAFTAVAVVAGGVLLGVARVLTAR